MARPSHVKDYCIIFDFGGQTTQLIARRCRELGVYSEILSHKTTASKLKELQPTALIFSGGPASVYAEGAPGVDTAIFDMDIPILGICYGLQLMVKELGGKVEGSTEREFGRAMLNIHSHEPLFGGIADSVQVWMSHGDKVLSLPEGFETLASSETCSFAAVRSTTKPFYGIQLHPEVSHTPDGKDMLRNFLVNIADCKADWKMDSFITSAIDDIQKQVGSANVVLGLSGGVDSAVAAALLQKAIGDQLHCIFIDNGLLRAGEFEYVQEVFQDHFHVNLRAVDAADAFLNPLAGVSDPEKKRKIIGKVFIDVFKEEADTLQDVKFLAQGTIYPDVIESAPPSKGPSATIKSHHNVGGLPEELHFELVEPLRDLFKDEVRVVGEALGLPHHIVNRHPFPGPGLGIRVLGDITREKLEVLRKADTIILDEIEAAGVYYSIWQAFGVLLPVQSVGVMGDERTYENTLAVRCVTSVDAMTADWAYLPEDLLRTISSRISNEVNGINRVVYDISSKPPSTIEWE